MTQIVIEATPRKSYDVSLVGIDYKLTPPKSALALKMANQTRNGADGATDVVDSIYTWVRSAFGPTQSKAIIKRLDDPEDLLDIEHLTQLMQKVMEVMTASPTT